MADVTNVEIPEGTELPDPTNSINTADTNDVEVIEYGEC